MSIYFAAGFLLSLVVTGVASLIVRTRRTKFKKILERELRVPLRSAVMLTVMVAIISSIPMSPSLHQAWLGYLAGVLVSAAILFLFQDYGGRRSKKRRARRNDVR